MRKNEKLSLFELNSKGNELTMEDVLMYLPDDVRNQIEEAGINYISSSPAMSGYGHWTFEFEKDGVNNKVTTTNGFLISVIDVMKSDDYPRSLIEEVIFEELLKNYV